MAEQTQQQHLLFHLLSKLSPQPLMANATTQQSPQSVTDCTLVQTIVNTDSMQKSPSESNFSDLEVSFPPFPVGKYSDVSTMDSTFSQPTGGSSAQFLADRSVPLAEDDSLVVLAPNYPPTLPTSQNCVPNTKEGHKNKNHKTKGNIEVLHVSSSNAASNFNSTPTSMPSNNGTSSKPTNIVSSLSLTITSPSIATSYTPQSHMDAASTLITITQALSQTATFTPSIITTTQPRISNPSP
ncbi:hypothetical protein LguiA_017961 [Lonicera macranthoides]